MTLFDQLEPTAAPLKGTIAADRGDAKAALCANCGLTAYVPTTGEWKATTKLGACPRCGGETWWRQSLPVASFGAVS